MNKILLLLLLYSTIIFSDGLKVFTTIYPNYNLIKPILGDYGSVVTIVPQNIEVHHFEPSTRDILSINKGDLFFYTSDILEPWVKSVSKNFPSSLTVVNNSSFVKNLNTKDTHIWLDPISAIDIVHGIATTLAKTDPKNKEYFMNNALDYEKKIKDLHTEYTNTLKSYKNKTIIYVGHNSFGYLESRYDINFLTPYSGYSVDSEPTPKSIQKIIDFGKKNNIKYVFYEKGTDSKFAETIAKELSAKTIPLDSLHSAKGDYVELMRANLPLLEKGLKNE
ncbi:MAG: zinc ABC transporter substrate-binding protein [Cetobacterium sp.]|uniref:metal ABC transporter solute-binding protein, Zn/Mn family n=1 Tax=Cetobacterium sp. TaxID=2071632 RepID=UPI002FC9C652